MVLIRFLDRRDPVQKGKRWCARANRTWPIDQTCVCLVGEFGTGFLTGCLSGEGVAAENSSRLRFASSKMACFAASCVNCLLEDPPQIFLLDL